MRGVTAGLRLTARLGFAWFWLSYAGPPAVRLLSPGRAQGADPWRAFGLAFAATLAVHLALLAELCRLGHVPSLLTFAIFGSAAAWVAALALASFPPIARAIGPRVFRVVARIGMPWVLLAFADDFVRVRPRADAAYAAGYGVFLVLIVAAAGLRLVDGARQRRVGAAPIRG